MDLNNATEMLEALIDKHGLLHVLTGLELVCGAKAAKEHLHWQAETLTARCWQQASDVCGRAARAVPSAL